jgi:hypothetical protein
VVILSVSLFFLPAVTKIEQKRQHRVSQRIYGSWLAARHTTSTGSDSDPLKIEPHENAH